MSAWNNPDHSHLPECFVELFNQCATICLAFRSHPHSLLRLGPLTKPDGLLAGQLQHLAVISSVFLSARHLLLQFQHNLLAVPRDPDTVEGRFVLIEGDSGVRDGFARDVGENLRHLESENAMKRQKLNHAYARV